MIICYLFYVIIYYSESSGHNKTFASCDRKQNFFGQFRCEIRYLEILYLDDKHVSYMYHCWQLSSFQYCCCGIVIWLLYGTIVRL